MYVCKYAWMFIYIYVCIHMHLYENDFHTCIHFMSFTYTRVILFSISCLHIYIYTYIYMIILRMVLQIYDRTCHSINSISHHIISNRLPISMFRAHVASQDAPGKECSGNGVCQQGRLGSVMGIAWWFLKRQNLCLIYGNLTSNIW